MSRGIRAIVAAVSLLALAACAPTPSGPVTATVASAAVDDAGYLVADGYVLGVAEDGGKCSFTFWSEGGGASRLSSTGVADGDRTACPPVDERIRTLWRGAYTAVLSYSSPTATAESEPFSFVIPAASP
jgi:hypothetical protein